MARQPPLPSPALLRLTSAASARQHFPPEQIQELDVGLVKEFSDDLFDSRTLARSNLLYHLLGISDDPPESRANVIKKGIE